MGSITFIGLMMELRALGAGVSYWWVGREMTLLDLELLKAVAEHEGPWGHWGQSSASPWATQGSSNKLVILTAAGI